MTYPEYPADTTSEDATNLQNGARTCEPVGTTLVQRRSLSVLGHTYFVQREDGLIKIGFSANPSRRVRTLEREHGKLDTLAVVPISVAGEFETHQRFASRRVEGEWFEPDPELLDFIAQVKDQPEPEPAPPTVDPAIAEIKAIGRTLCSRWNKLSTRARNFASNIIAQAKEVQTLEDLERLRPHIAYQTRRLAEAMGT